MHSRSFLHRTTTTPSASVTQSGPEGHYPLGFANVRDIAPPDGPERQRSPIGFAPVEPQFVTELSFRRTAPRADAQVPAPGSPAGPIGVGHASGWRPTDLPELGDTEPATTTPVSEVPSESSAAEHVPFYKREISLRRRKRSDSDAPAPVEPVGEVVSDDHDEAERDEQPERQIGFAAPAEEPEPESADVEDDEIVALDDDADHASADEGANEVSTDEPVAIDEDADVVDGPDEESERNTLAAEADELDIVDAEIEEIQDSIDEPQAESAEQVEVVDLDATPEGAELPDEPKLSDEPAAELDPELDEHSAEADAEHPAADSAPVAIAAADESSPKRRSIRARRGAVAAAPKESGPKGGRGGRKVVGLKIGASQLAAAVVTRTNGQDELVGLARMSLEPGIVVDGEVRDAEALKDALQTFFDENKLPRRDVTIGVASNRIGVRTVDISGIDDQERFDNAVRFKAHEVLPVSFSESVLDYRVVEERATENGDLTKRVLLVVAPKDQVEPFVAACAGAGLKLAGVDLEALGLLRAFVLPQAAGSRLSTDTATVVVAIGHESTTLLVSGGGTCEFTRVFDWGGLALQQAIAQELDIHTIEATNILHGLSLVGQGRADLDEGMRARALDAVRTRLTPFARELVSSLQFYQAQSGSLGIGEIVITGGTSRLEGLADALHQMIGVSVRVGDPLQRLSVPHPIDPEHEASIGSFAVPVGLAIADDAARGVNLLPDDFRRQRRKKPGALQIALPVAAVVPLAALGFMFLQANGDVSSQKSDLVAVQAQIDALPEPPRAQIDASMAVDQQQRAAALATVLGGRLAWDRVLGDLSRVLPANVWLTKFTAQTPQEQVLPTAAAVSGQPVGATIPAAPTGVTIEGYTYSVPDVAKVLSRLSTVPSLTNVVLGSTEEREMGKKQAIAFTIVADIDGNGGAK